MDGPLVVVKINLCINYLLKKGLTTNQKIFISSAKSTELLHSPPVYEDPDLDAVDHDFYDYAGVSSVPDDDFYYVSWEDPIYDNFYDYSGKWTPTIVLVYLYVVS